MAPDSPERNPRPAAQRQCQEDRERDHGDWDHDFLGRFDTGLLTGFFGDLRAGFVALRFGSVSGASASVSA